MVHVHDPPNLIAENLLSAAEAADLLSAISMLDVRKPCDHPEINSILGALVNWKDRTNAEELVMRWIHWLAQVRS
jgi:hypothetical protein